MPNYPKNIYLQNNLRLTEKRTVRQFDARILGVDNSTGPTQRPNYAIPVLDWINERIEEGDIILPITPETNLSVIDTSTIDFSVSGTANHTLTGNVKISPNIGNQISSLSNGLFVPASNPETVLTAIDSSSINFSVSGTNNHTITGSVIIPSLISSDSNNQIITGNDGKLFVSSTNTFTCSDLGTCSIDNLGNGILTINGLSGDGKTGTPVKLGGTLNQNTIIDGSTNTYNLTFNNIKSFSITSGSNPGNAGSSKVFQSFDLPTNYSSPAGYNVLFNNITHNLDNLSLTNGRGIVSLAVNSNFNILANTTIGNGSVIVGQFNITKFNAKSTNLSLQRNQGTGGTTYRFLYNQATGIQLDSGSTTTNEHITFNKFANFGVFTNYDNTFNSNKFTQFVQLYIGNAKGDADETDIANMPDSYGVWQEGADDKNLFRGPIILPAIATYANDAAAGIGGLTSGTLYKTSTGEIRIKL